MCVCACVCSSIAPAQHSEQADAAEVRTVGGGNTRHKGEFTFVSVFVCPVLPVAVRCFSRPCLFLLPSHPFVNHPRSCSYCHSYSHHIFSVFQVTVPETLSTIVDVIYDKAVMEPNFAALYARVRDLTVCLVSAFCINRRSHR